jgi:hypothetical protein
VDQVRFKAEVRFNGVVLAEKFIRKYDLGQVHTSLESKEKLERFLVEYGDGFTKFMAEEVDRLEREIKNRVPSVRHVDLETD